MVPVSGRPWAASSAATSRRRCSRPGVSATPRHRPRRRACRSRKAFGHPPPFALTVIDGDKVARKIKKTQSNGKGAPTKTESEGFIATRVPGVRGGRSRAYARIFRNEKLVYLTIEGDNIDVDSANFAAQVVPVLRHARSGCGPVVGGHARRGEYPRYPGRAYFVVIDDDETQTQGAANRYRVEVIAAGEQTTTCYPQWIATDGLGNFQTSNGTDWLTNEAFSASATGKFMRYNNGVLLLEQ